MRISDWSSDVCSSDLGSTPGGAGGRGTGGSATMLIDVDPLFASLTVSADGIGGTGGSGGTGGAGGAGTGGAALLDLSFGATTVNGALRVTAREIGRASCRERVCQYV